MSNVISGLGHGICDSDTGEILELKSGEMVTATIHSVTKGKSGSAGELHGQFLYGSVAEILLNLMLYFNIVLILEKILIIKSIHYSKHIIPTFCSHDINIPT
jgi:hypothetical protein